MCVGGWRGCAGARARRAALFLGASAALSDAPARSHAWLRHPTPASASPCGRSRCYSVGRGRRSVEARRVPWHARGGQCPARWPPLKKKKPLQWRVRVKLTRGSPLGREDAFPRAPGTVSTASRVCTTVLRLQVRSAGAPCPLPRPACGNGSARTAHLFGRLRPCAPARSHSLGRCVLFQGSSSGGVQCCPRSGWPALATHSCVGGEAGGTGAQGAVAWGDARSKVRVARATGSAPVPVCLLTLRRRGSFVFLQFSLKKPNEPPTAACAHRPAPFCSSPRLPRRSAPASRHTPTRHGRLRLHPRHPARCHGRRTGPVGARAVPARVKDWQRQR